MAVSDALMAKSGNCGAPGTVYLTGPVITGGSNVQEIDIRGLNLHRGLAMLFMAPATVTGTADVSVEGSADAAFTTPKTVLPAITLSAGGRHNLGYVYGTPLNYLRYKVVVAAASNFGTCWGYPSFDGDTRIIGA